MRSKAELYADIRHRATVALVVNARSRRGYRLYTRARRHLDTEGFQVVLAVVVTDPARLEEALSAAVTAGADLVVVGGGDGTLSAAAKHLAHRDLCLGPAPGHNQQLCPQPAYRSVFPRLVMSGLASSVDVPFRSRADVESTLAGQRDFGAGTTSRPASAAVGVATCLG